MSTILITGGTGMIGTRLAKMLVEKNYQVIILTRDPQKHSSGHERISYAAWDIGQQTIDANAIANADHIIHLAGEGVADKRWSRKRKQEIVNSRTQSSSLLVKALEEIPNKVQTVVSASAIGWYGPDTVAGKQNGFTEEVPADTHFLGETCRRWEESIQPVEAMGKRLIKLRTGIVIGPSGGALKEFRQPLKFGIATILGNGEQVLSWIQLDDLCRLYIAAIEHKQLQGVYNAVAPFPVTNRQLVLALAKQLRGESYIPVYVPALILKIVLGEMSIEVLKSATVSAEKITASGFRFLYPSIEEALAVSV